jgi:DNA-binding MarR family transcriptional regulator
LNMHEQKYEEAIKSMAKELQAQSRNPKVRVFLSFLYTADIFHKFLDSVLTYKNVSRSGFSVLHYLILNGGCMIPTMISKKTKRSKYSVTRVIDTLEKMGLVERLLTGTDRRNKRVKITEKGLEVVSKATLASREHLCSDIFQTLDAERLTELDNILKDLRKNLFALMAEKEWNEDSNRLPAEKP